MEMGGIGKMQREQKMKKKKEEKMKQGNEK